MNSEFIPLSEILEIENLRFQVDDNSPSNLFLILTESNNEDKGFLSKIKRVFQRIIDTIINWVKRALGFLNKDKKKQVKAIPDITKELESLNDILIHLSVDIQFISRIRPGSNRNSTDESIDQVIKRFEFFNNDVSEIKERLESKQRNPIKVEDQKVTNKTHWLLTIIQDEAEEIKKSSETVFKDWKPFTEEQQYIKDRTTHDLLPKITSTLSMVTSSIGITIQIITG